jgi:hypothetical protein
VLASDQGSFSLPHEFFTIQSMLTFGGATAATFVITNAIYKATGWSPKWLGLVIAVVLAIAGVYYSHGQGVDYIAGLANGCLIYLAAAGGTAGAAAAAGTSTRSDTVRGSQQEGRSLFEPWF